MILKIFSPCTYKLYTTVIMLKPLSINATDFKVQVQVQEYLHLVFHWVVVKMVDFQDVLLDDEEIHGINIKKRPATGKKLTLEEAKGSN
jgi:hypothetical protein